MIVKGSLAGNTNISDERMKVLVMITIEHMDRLTKEKGREPMQSEFLNAIATDSRVISSIELLVIGSTAGRAYMKAES